MHFFPRTLYADYVRHGRSLRSPALWTLGVYRLGMWARGLAPPGRWLSGKLYGALFFGVEICTGNTINAGAAIGKDIHLIHSGNIRIHPDVVIGDRVGIMNDVTIGTNMGRGGVPVIGNDVFIGVGARVLGPVKIGDGARIAPNSLVMNDVPPGATAIGVPARVVQYTGRRAPHVATVTHIDQVRATEGGAA